ncbi:NAD(P)/FAD-dependent oxidoreductase [Nocardioides maradonensis]
MSASSVKPTVEVDVLVVGAGLSGIGVASHLSRDNAGTSLLVLERRQAIGGTWDLFRYPGVRSDSDMYTFGYDFKPWHGTKVLADGASIRGYVEETARENGLMDKIRFGRKVVRADWSSDTGRWAVTAVTDEGITETYSARFLAGCTGYYDYDNGHRPTFPGEETFTGQFVHPQFWPEDLDYAGKRVVVIGSGATAITLVPAMASGPNAAEHVTMLQRSPTYILSLPSHDPVALGLEKAKVPADVRYKIGRARNVALQRGMYKLSKSKPAVARRLVLQQIKAQLGRKVDMKHFTPRYNPWDQRLCVVPNGDLFRVLKSHKADIVTDRIASFTPTGIKLEGGDEIQADIVVTATGLVIQLFGGAEMYVDGEKVETHDHLLYKGTMFTGVPNAMFVIGYTNASWTLKADLLARFFSKLVARMQKNPGEYAVVQAGADDADDHSIMGESLTSGYIERGDVIMPRQGKRIPFRQLDSYYADVKLHKGEVDADGALEFRKIGEPVSQGTGAPVVAK